MSGSKPKPKPPYRVPRSKIDERFPRSDPLSDVKVGSGEVVSVAADGETMTVNLDDETVSGVVPLGCPPEVGDWVEVHQRGDLLVSPEAASDWWTASGGNGFGGFVYVQPDEPLLVPVGTLWFDTDEARP